MTVTRNLPGRQRMLAFAFVAALVMPAPGVAQEKPVDNFDAVNQWRALPSDGVTMTIGQAPGVTGKAMAIDFSFQAGSGFAIAQRDVDLLIPDNYRFSFYLRGETPVNNFEFKMLDAAGNVWWVKRLNIEYPASWKKMSIKRRHISFAWGPSGGGLPTHISKIEFVVSAGTGGKGRVFIDDLRFEAITAEKTPAPVPVVTTGSPAGGKIPVTMLDSGAVAPISRATRAWTGQAPGGSVTIDFGRQREIGGLSVDWDSMAYAKAYTIRLSDNGKTWIDAAAVTHSNGGRDYILLPETETRYLRIVLDRAVSTAGCGIRGIQIRHVRFSETQNAVNAGIASEHRRGLFPRYTYGEQSNWTIAGVSGDTREALINEDGMVELDKGRFSVEPFLYVDGRLLTWNDGSLDQLLENRYLPIPHVRRFAGDLKLDVRACASGEAGKSVLLLTYSITNNRPAPTEIRFFLAVRPFQVNPPWQDLNVTAGAAPLETITYDNGELHADEKTIIPLSMPQAVGATPFEAGDITEYLEHGVVPATPSVHDPGRRASAALAYVYTLPGGATGVLQFVIPFHDHRDGFTPMMGGADDRVNERVTAMRDFWTEHLNRVNIQLPRDAGRIADVFRSNLAYILINRDGSAIQPGSRTYERAWIRDGSLTSSALLRTGNISEVRDYLDWYAPHQYPNGKVPCVVDTRGADPVPEHDSHGQLIYAIMQYFLYSRDTTWLAGKFPYVLNAVRYIQSLRAERKTDVYRNGTPVQRACYGLVPESISHEGYSSHPMHSYWDDFFVLRGLKDAATIAGILGDDAHAREFAQERDDMSTCLYASIRLTMETKHIDYIPGCAELGDFDATSTTTAIDPGGELGRIPEPGLTNTFNKYYTFFSDRAAGKLDWTNYTPYEVRTIGSFVHLGQPARAHEAMNFFIRDIRPQGWNHWAEVVWRDPKTPRYIGDMPHTWVGSDFLRSVYSMFILERENDSTLVLGAGIEPRWLNDPKGFSVSGFQSTFGPISMAMRRAGTTVTVQLDGTLLRSPGHMVLASPLRRPVAHADINGSPVTPLPDGSVRIPALPATVHLTYAD